jgi:hypothetical protein
MPTAKRVRPLSTETPASSTNTTSRQDVAYGVAAAVVAGWAE